MFNSEMDTNDNMSDMNENVKLVKKLKMKILKLLTYLKMKILKLLTYLGNSLKEWNI